MELKGVVNDFIYQNEENGYTICTFKQEDKKTITIVGYLPFINSGDTLKIAGNFVSHPEYGEQFKIETFEKCMPDTLEGLEKYLGGGVVKGIGPAMAKRIVKAFKEETLNILKNEPQKLSTLKGISEKKAEEICEEFNTNWELWRIIGFLERFGISTSNCKKVYDALGINAITKIEENPYILMDITYGVDFKKIDKIAIDLGTDVNSDKRIACAIKYAINLASNNGHTCVLKQNLIQYIEGLLQIKEENIQNVLINSKVKGEIVQETRRR